ncbi:hypothetical protein [Nonomuraea sp. 10N515B]|uniref:hypothetical protein n=1 Tax=Nonomuraea sp. 10N515B TaxID=3457422 RepID=UPI003FCED1B9
MEQRRIVIHFGGVEWFEGAVSLLAAAQARPIGRSRTFAVEGPTITATQADAIHRLAEEDGVAVPSPPVPDGWTIIGEYQEIPEMDFGEAEAWWKASYDNRLSR